MPHLVRHFFEQFFVELNVRFHRLPFEPVSLGVCCALLRKKRRQALGGGGSGYLKLLVGCQRSFNLISLCFVSCVVC